MIKKLLLGLAFVASTLSAQVTTGYHRVSQVVARGSSGTQAVVVPNANIYVTSTSTGTVATIYSDPLLSIPIPSGMVTSDASGNFSYYIPLTYCVNERASYPGSGNFTTTNICSLGGGGTNEIIPGSNVTCTPETGGNCTGTVTINSTTWGSTVSSAPAGSCAVNGQFATVISTGAVYQCLSGTWSQNTALSSTSLQTNGVPNTSQAVLNHVDTPSVAWSNPSGGIEEANVNFSGSLTMQIIPPIAGQYVYVPATSYSITQSDGPVSASNTSATMTLGTGAGFEIDDTVVWSGFALPSYVLPGNVTAIYAVGISNQTNFFLYNGILAGPGQGMTPGFDCTGAVGHLVGSGPLSGGWTGQQVTQGTTLTGATFNTTSCTAHIGANFSGGGDLIVSKVGYLVYYTGTAPPLDSSVIIAPPLTFNPDDNTLSVFIPNTAALDTGTANAYAVTLAGVKFQSGLTITVNLANASTSTTPTLAFNGNAPRTIVGPTGSTLASGDMVTARPAMLTWSGTNWVLQNPQVSGGGGGGITTNALTMNNSGTGDVSGSTFNGAAAKTISYNSIGADCALTLTTTGSSGAATLGACSGGTHALNIPQYTGGGSGITSINSQTGPAITIHSSDSSVTVSTTTNDIDLTTAGGSSGVQYNPTTTAYFVTSFSGLYDDNDNNSRSLGVPSSVSCTGTGPYTCTVNFATAHGLSVGGAIDMTSLASWPIDPLAGGLQQAAQYGSFQVTTVPTSTQITFTTPTSLSYTCSPCTGNAYDASLWGIWQFAKQPYIYGHGTVYGIETTTQSAAAQLATWIGTITGTPKFLIDQTGQNDLVAGRTVAQIEADHQTLWAAAHTAGMTVVETTMVPAQYGLTGYDIKPGQYNYWLWTQALSKTATQISNGQYIDRYIDTASALLKTDNINSMPNPSVNQVWAQAVNEAFGVQAGLPVPPPSNFTYSSSGLGSDTVGHYYGLGQAEFFYDIAWNNWMTFAANAGGSAGIDLYSNTFNSSSMLRLNFPGLGTGLDWLSDGVFINGTANNGFWRGFHYAGSGSTSNYLLYRPEGGSTDAVRFYVNGNISFPASLGTTASTSPICPNGTNGELTTVGCAGGGGTTTNALTAAATGGAAPGTTFNGGAAVTLDYHSFGAAPLASPTLTGIPAAPTAVGGTNTTQLATTAFVQAAIAAAGTGAGIVTYSGPAVALTGTQYFPIGGGATSSTTETNVDIDAPAAVTIQNMTVQMSVAPGIGNSIVFTWRKNATNTALTCTISGASATSCSDTTHNFSTAALDLLDISTVTTGTVAGTPTVVMAAQVGVGTAGSVASLGGWGTIV